MKPIDIRNESFHEISGRLAGDRERVYLALAVSGGVTTRQLADRMGVEMGCVRPRVTELCQIGAVKLVGRTNHEGLYQVLTVGEWALWITTEKTRADGERRGSASERSGVGSSPLLGLDWRTQWQRESRSSSRATPARRRP